MVCFGWFAISVFVVWITCVLLGLLVVSWLRLVFVCCLITLVAFDLPILFVALLVFGCLCLVACIC